ncbi:hypothetical protein KAR91_29785 [Candidatus Pacearchaeota archaeon]|nr:hypothetical protein [Candidatus Pacearchaeota archaeon]
MKRSFYIVFSDLKGFSKLIEEEISVFQEQVLVKLRDEIRIEKEKSAVWNTWGDAVFTAFEDGKIAAEFMIKYRDFFNNFDFESIGIKKIVPRIAAHFGQAEIFDDPILGAINLFGVNINTTARIEPVTRAGEIFVTKEFKDNFCALGNNDSICFDELGIIKLAKAFGELEVFRLRKSGEKKQIIDRIIKQDLITYLPDVQPLTDEEERKIRFYENSPDKEELLVNIRKLDFNTISLRFIFEILKIEKKYGAYKEALRDLKILENRYILVDDIKVYPYRHKQEFIKLKVNIQTRLGLYDEAANDIYGLWNSGFHNSDTLSMLAAQYKRKSLYGNSHEVSRNNLNYDLLSRAKNLYIEAFRTNIEDYYPAINAAYLYRIIGGNESGKGIKLAQYIVSSWSSRIGESWWLDSTLAEAELLQEDFEESKLSFAKAIERHKPNIFQKNSTLEQINLFSKLLDLEKNVEKIIALFN